MIVLFVFIFFFNDTATTEIYTRSIVGSVRCVQETDQRRVHGEELKKMIQLRAGKSLVTLKYYWLYSGEYYFILDDISSETLRKYVKRMKSLPFKTLLSFVKKLGSALEFLHLRKIYHRPTPDCIFLYQSSSSPIPQIKLAGISPIIQNTWEKEPSDWIIYNSSPEDKPETEDIYYFGSVIYFMLYGNLDGHPLGPFPEIKGLNVDEKNQLKCLQKLISSCLKKEISFISQITEEKIFSQSSQPTISFLSLIHISEPTRPLYISYAVFCLKKKKKNNESKHPLSLTPNNLHQ
eukprot:TRINITY_DN53321_c0_g1_i1.p1 TRINITY_DN53321_c0_g1~~TRINITY_DN53321_c0_g1_i1.p1  ORF type:complete len:292 (+),score=58.34 TRINITY_DN53321_c0_g1_i1:38-913(+)